MTQPKEKPENQPSTGGENSSENEEDRDTLLSRLLVSCDGKVVVAGEFAKYMMPLMRRRY